MMDAIQAQLEFLKSELLRFEACGAWERSDNPRYVSRMFLVPKPGHNQWRLIIDLRELNRYCWTFNMTCETLKHLRHLSRLGDYFLSKSLTDGYYTFSIREGDRDYFTVSYHGTLWRLACLPIGLSGSAYYFYKLAQVFTNYLRRPPPPTPAALHMYTHALRNISYGTPGGAVRDYFPTWTIFFSWPTRTTTRWCFASASKPYSTACASSATPRKAYGHQRKSATT
jgi:hypothetical protein